MTHGSSSWAWPPCFMTCYYCGKLGRLARKKKEFGSRNHLRCTCLCFYTLTGTSPAPGVCKQVCVCFKERFAPMDACFLGSDVFNPETLEGALSFTFPRNQVKSFKLIRFYYFRSESQSLQSPKPTPRGSPTGPQIGLGSVRNIPAL